jgi:hypothetical protein
MRSIVEYAKKVVSGLRIHQGPSHMEVYTKTDTTITLLFPCIPLLFPCTPLLFPYIPLYFHYYSPIPLHPLPPPLL